MLLIEKMEKQTAVETASTQTNSELRGNEENNLILKADGG